MDYRLALLLHTPLGLKLEAVDIEALLDPTVDPYDPRVDLKLVTQRARVFTHSRRQWREEAQSILELSARRGIRWCSLADPEYPEAWRRISKQPVVFSYRGEPCWQNHEMISVVGSRTPAAETLQWMQRELSAFLKNHSLALVSGGARGVDQWAHRLALDSRRPTICILPSGLLNPYPFKSDDLWDRIVREGGCLLSTCALNEGLKRSFFHTRNRWIAGLSSVCFVAEANRRSGSQMTARIAMEENKTVCTLPVFPLSTQGLGNLDLINQGVFMLRDEQDLSVLWNGSIPAAAQSVQRKEQKHSIDQPQADGGWQPPLLRDIVGADVADPVADQ